MCVFRWLDQHDAIPFAVASRSSPPPVLQIPSVDDLTSGRARIDALRPVAIEDLLGQKGFYAANSSPWGMGRSAAIASFRPRLWWLVAVEAGGLVKSARELLMPGACVSLSASPARLLRPQRHSCGIKEVSV